MQIVTKFTCNDCHGLCCVNPPLLRTFEEGMFAKRLGVEIVASKHTDNGYMIAIAKKKDVCPLLDVESGKCTIYDNRFESCRAYKCGLTELTHAQAFISLMTDYGQAALNTGIHIDKPRLLTKSQIRKIGAKVIHNQNKLIQKIVATNVETFLALTEKIFTD